MQTPNIDNLFNIAEEVRALQMERNRLQNELAEANAWIFGMLLSNGGKLKYNEAHIYELKNGLRNGIKQANEMGLTLIEGHNELWLSYKDVSIYDRGGIVGWATMAQNLPELFKSK